ncbi:histidine phosphatase family protein, partial [Streptomyces sp. NRRL F-4489]|uniref:histidine phosphatase family protein n=1 Tax=Streptomyces sp. NRRL F-4489 TaxID=1609095 RepID=UPI000AF01D92
PPAEFPPPSPHQLPAFPPAPAAPPPPGGDPPRHAARRAAACLTDLTRDHPHGRILIVAHSTLLRVLLCHLLGIPLAAYRRTFPELHNGALTEIRLTGGHTALLRLNAPALAPSPALH